MDDVRQELKQQAQGAVAQCRRGEYREALEILEAVLGRYKNEIGRMPARLLSYYGVCLAEEKNKISDAIDFCRTAVTKDPFHADHYANLARVYHLGRARKKAVDALSRAQKLDLDNTLAGNLWGQMGRRRQPVLKFLHRDHPLNVLFGRVFRRHRSSQEND